MEQQQRGRGRARGASRPMAQEGGGQQRPGGVQQRPQAPRGPPPANVQHQPQGVWGARQQQQQPPPQQQRPAPIAQSQGRAVVRGAGDGPGPSKQQDSQFSQPPSGAGDGSRGSHRGKRTLHDIVIKTRPETCISKKGECGRVVKLCANYFRMLTQPDWCLYQYRVDFAPEEDNTIRRKGMFRTAVKDIDMSGYLFDGTVMYTPRRLSNDPMELFVDSLDGGEKIRITIRLVGDVNQADHHYLQIFNIIMRKCMSYLKLQLVQRNYYDARAKINIANFNLEIWPGYVTSIRQHEKNVLMCCEITHKIMRNDTVLDLLMECSKEDRANYRRTFTDRIVGQVVLTGYNNKTYRIDDVDFNITPASTFPRKDGTSISYIEYYKTRYNINIRQKDQPMLLSKAKPRELRAGMAETIILVPELCRMTGLTEQQRANFHMMKALAEYTRVGPAQRIEKLHNFCRSLKSQPEAMNEMKQWHTQLDSNIIEFTGRVLPTEQIFGGDNAKYSAGQFVDWTKDLRSTKMFDSRPLRNWVIVFPVKVGGSVQKFMQMLIRAGQGMGWNLADAQPFKLNDDRIGSYIASVDAITSKGEPELIMFVLMNNKNDRYSSIKKKCCVDKAIPTQMIVARNLDSKGAMSIATKVAIQLNCKIGGSPWAVKIPMKSLMVVGFDVCHDPSNKAKSFGALVASLDVNVTRYFSTVSSHSNGEELSNDFALNLTKGLKAFHQCNGFLPERIMIYRDGVGDGQLKYVHEHEVETIKKKLLEFYNGRAPKLIFIIVSKRINTRVFTQSGNPEPGTVIDDVITLPERYDFYIVSQCTRQGTVSPTSYNIIEDTFGLDANKIQMLTYKFTHMYFNWSGTVRVPAPCQYAHKLAFLVAQSLHRTPNVGLEKLLYYL